VKILPRDRALAAAANMETPRPAIWAGHAVVIDVVHLPGRYTCDVLLAIGARTDLKGLSY
jgi:hypothetical protein